MKPILRLAQHQILAGLAMMALDDFCRLNARLLHAMQMRAEGNRTG